MYLYVQQWELNYKKYDDYVEFVLKKHLPVMEKMGLNIIGAYKVVIGSGPAISVVALVKDFKILQQILENEEVIKVNKEFNKFVFSYSSVLLKDTERVKDETYEIRTGSWRFNQYFKLFPGVEKEYDNFLKNIYIPTIEALGIKIKREWQVVIGTSNRILLEGSISSFNKIEIITSEKFKTITNELLLNYAFNYSSRLLISTGRVELAHFLSELTRAI